MPTYDYVCDACDHAFELFQSIKDGAEAEVPASAGSKKLRRLIGPGAAIVFKGSGFYTTDYRSESYKKAAAADKPAAARQRRRRRQGQGKGVREGQQGQGISRRGVARPERAWPAVPRPFRACHPLPAGVVSRRRVRTLSQVRCPICERSFDSDESRTLPFCSKRCKQIDLRRWLSRATVCRTSRGTKRAKRGLRKTTLERPTIPLAGFRKMSKVQVPMFNEGRPNRPAPWTLVVFPTLTRTIPGGKLHLRSGCSNPTENPVMNCRYTAVIQQDSDWWIGWMTRESLRVNSHGETREELLENLQSALREAIEMNCADAKAAAKGEYSEESILV